MDKRLLALLSLIVLTLSIAPAVSITPPGPPSEEAEPEIAVKIEGSWLHTIPKPPFEIPDDLDPVPDWMNDWTYCWPIPDGEVEEELLFAPYELEAPQFCNTFNVEIWVLNVTNLYGYDFTLIWNYGWLNLESYSIVDIGEGMGEQHYIDLDPFTAGMQPALRQVWGHLGETEGFTGSAVVANLVFHINQDPVWEDDEKQAFYSAIYILDSEATGPDTEEIVLRPKHAIVKLVSTKPKVSFTPEDMVIVWEQGKQITWTIDVENVIKMKSMWIQFDWNNTVFDPWTEEWVDYPLQLILDPQKHPIEITDFLPGPYEYYEVSYDDTSVEIDVWRDCEKPGVNGTGDLAYITLTAISPWGYKTCSIPEFCYEDKRKVIPPYQEYEFPGAPCQGWQGWLPDECHDNVTMSLMIDGYKCVQDNPHQHWDLAQDRPAPYMGYYFNGTDFMGGNWTKEYYEHDFALQWTLYDFRPIAGDFNMNGHAGLEDIMAMAEWYGAPTTLVADLMDKGLPYAEAYARAMEIWATCLSDYDIMPDPPSANEIDIFDLTVIGKNFCSEVPFHWDWEEEYLDP